MVPRGAGDGLIVRTLHAYPIPPRCYADSQQMESQTDAVYFLRNEQPSVNRALPPVGWHLGRSLVHQWYLGATLTYRTCEQPWQTTTVFACEKTVVMVKQPGHLTSMKNERGAGTSCLSLCLRASLRRC
jgi:hypothetical protein